MPKASRKHHYLPVFYLKGFTNAKGRFCVYNKHTDTFHDDVSPTSIFFEKDLNNFIHEGKIAASTEDGFYMRQDSRAATFLHNYLHDKVVFTDEVSAEYKFELTWFIVNLFWRIPNSNKKFEDLVLRHGIHNKYFQIVDTLSTDAIPKEFIEQIQSDILNNAENKKVFKLAYPFISADSEEILRIMQMSKDYSIVSNYKLITGDNPFISNSTYTDIENILGELIFPFSSDRLLIATKSKPDYLSMQLFMNINIAIIHQSERFVCSHNPDNLGCVDI